MKKERGKAGKNAFPLLNFRENYRVIIGSAKTIQKRFITEIIIDVPLFFCRIGCCFPLHFFCCSALQKTYIGKNNDMRRVGEFL